MHGIDDHTTRINSKLHRLKPATGTASPVRIPLYDGDGESSDKRTGRSAHTTTGTGTLLGRRRVTALRPREFESGSSWLLFHHRHRRRRRRRPGAAGGRGGGGDLVTVITRTWTRTRTRACRLDNGYRRRTCKGGFTAAAVVVVVEIFLPLLLSGCCVCFCTWRGRCSCDHLWGEDVVECYATVV